MPSTSIPTSRTRRGGPGGLTTPSLGAGRAALLVLLLAAAAVVAGPAAPAQACRCVDAPTAQHHAEADVVFTGSLVSRTVEHPPETGADPATWVFAVDRAVKGAVPEEVAVRSAESGASCGLELTGTGPFVVFAVDAGTHLSAGLCQGTAALTPSLEGELAALADGSAVVLRDGASAPASPDVEEEAEPGGWPGWAYVAGTVGLLALAAAARRAVGRGRAQTVRTIETSSRSSPGATRRAAGMRPTSR